MNATALFQQIQSRSSLRPTATVVRDRRGRVQVERSELLSDSQKAERVASSVAAGLKRKGVVNDSCPHDFPIVSGVLHHFDASSKEWRTGSAPRESGHHVMKALKVITWNVWFSEHEWERRLHGLVTTAMEVEMADVICLQEVTPRFLHRLMEYPSVQNLYHLVISVAPKSWYGVAMLVQKWIRPPKIEIVSNMKSRMGRTALIAELEGDGLAIATVHLESLNSRATRSHQLQCIRQALAKYDNALLVGDYNITGTGPWADREEEAEILSKNLGPEFMDWWNTVHPEAETSTIDSSANTMLKATTRFADKARYDRAYLRLMSKIQELPLEADMTEDDVVTKTTGARYDRASLRQSTATSSPTTTEWQPGDICVIGDSPVGTDPKGTPIFVSDHFGLVMELRRM